MNRSTSLPEAPSRTTRNDATRTAPVSRLPPLSVYARHHVWTRGVKAFIINASMNDDMPCGLNLSSLGRPRKRSRMQPTPALVAEIIDNLRRVFQVVNEQSKRVERETGLTGPQLWAIKVIAENAPIKISELARRMYLHPATIVGIVDRLEKRGLVERERCSKDRRVVHVGLTDAGRQVVVTSPEVAQGLLVRGLEVLPDVELRTIAGGFERMVKILGAQEIPPHLLLSPEVNVPRNRPLAGQK